MLYENTAFLILFYVNKNNLNSEYLCPSTIVGSVNLANQNLWPWPNLTILLRGAEWHISLENEEQ